MHIPYCNPFRGHLSLRPARERQGNRGKDRSQIDLASTAGAIVNICFKRPARYPLIQKIRFDEASNHEH